MNERLMNESNQLIGHLTDLTEETGPAFFAYAVHGFLAEAVSAAGHDLAIGAKFARPAQPAPGFGHNCNFNRI